jgi:hypothetical protein
MDNAKAYHFFRKGYDMADRLPLTDLPRTLIEAGYSAPRYRSLYTAATDARIPADKDAGGRWTFRADDLPAIADAMSLAPAHAA